MSKASTARPRPFTQEIALQHERVTPRVAALLAQVERLAVRRGDQAVPAAVLGVTKTLFAEAHKVLGREAMRTLGRGFADLGALAVALGQLKAALDAFEELHCGWSPKLNTTVWWLDDKKEMQVSRLRLKAPMKGRDPASRPRDFDADAAREKIYKRWIERENLQYAKGYHDARNGIPPMAELTKITAIADYTREIWPRTYPHSVAPR